MGKKIKLGIDVDDCICNTLEMDYACAYYMCKNKNILPKEIDKTYYDVAKTFQMENGEKFYLQEKEYIMMHNSMYPKVFVKEVVKKLREKGFEIIFITSRHNRFWNGNAKLYLIKWLKKFGIKYDKIYASISNKSDICISEKIDYMIEDNCNYVKEVNEKGIKSILIKTTYNEHYNHELNLFAENWLDVYDILSKLYNFNGDDLISLK